MPNSVFRIGIDCRLAGQRHAGIGRYTENLVRELLQLPNQVCWVLFFSDQEQADQVLAPISAACRKKTEVVLAPFRHYSLREQVEMPRLFQQKHLDILHVPHFNVPLFYSGKVVVTIHDLLWHEYKGADVTTLPMWQYWPKYTMYRLTVNRAVERANRIIVPAKTVASQVSQYYPDATSKILVTPEGVDERFFTQKAAAQPQKYLVYLGSLYPHKNVRLVLQALGSLKDYTLKIVSARTVFQANIEKDVRRLNLGSRVEFLGFLTDDEIAHQLGNATALVQPSLSEGFGLTGIEAMAAGTPVLASDIPIFREVYRDHATFFDPHSVDAFVNAVHSVEQLNRLKFTEDARQFVKTYQWSKMAKQTMSLYTSILEGHSVA
jgi:glycosyltransferase involved in cell wall biosynthesis